MSGTVHPQEFSKMDVEHVDIPVSLGSPLHFPLFTVCSQLIESAHVGTAHKGLLQKRLQKDLYRPPIVPPCPHDDPIGQGTELTDCYAGSVSGWIRGSGVAVAVQGSFFLHSRPPYCPPPPPSPHLCTCSCSFSLIKTKGRKRSVFHTTTYRHR